ncbi:MAG: hypothetical protein ALAOOOJD_03965 [bacterium]|nr:hypothetical protein [bacterium]
MAGTDQVRAFIVEKFLFGDGKNFTDEDSLLGKGIIDSTGILSLIAFIEQECDIKIEDHEIIPANLDSVKKITAFLHHKQNSLTNKQEILETYAAFGG